MHSFGDAIPRKTLTVLTGSFFCVFIQLSDEDMPPIPAMVVGLSDDELGSIGLCRRGYHKELLTQLSERIGQSFTQRQKLLEQEGVIRDLKAAVRVLKKGVDHLAGEGMADLLLDGDVTVPTEPDRLSDYHYPLCSPGHPDYFQGFVEQEDGEPGLLGDLSNDEVFLPEDSLLDDPSAGPLTTKSGLENVIRQVANSEDPATRKMLRDMGYASPEPPPAPVPVDIVPRSPLESPENLEELKGVDVKDEFWGLVVGPLPRFPKPDWEMPEESRL